MVQLRRAADAGFVVPKTRVTNDVKRLRELASSGTWVLKGLSAPLLTEPDGDGAFVFTEWLEPDLVLGADTLPQAPMIVQEAVWPKVDVRVTVIGDRSFSAHTVVSTLDWRISHKTASFVVHDLPRDIAAKCIDLTKQLGLEFGAIDLAMDADGTYHFLEINPNGEWGWLQKSLGLPISEAITDRLSA